MTTIISPVALINGRAHVNNTWLAQQLCLTAEESRPLIEGNREALENFGELYTERGRRPPRYWLNENQAHFLCLESPDAAAHVQWEFDAWRSATERKTESPDWSAAEFQGETLATHQFHYASDASAPMAYVEGYIRKDIAASLLKALAE